MYIGNGTVIKSRGLDPYRNVDVAGKIVVSNVGLPTGFSQADLKGRRGEDWEMTEDAAQRRGAVAVLFLPDFNTLERWPVSRDTRRTRTTLTVDAFREAGPVLPAATLTARGVSAMFAGQQVPPQEAFQRGLRREPAEPFVLSPGTVVRLSVAMADEHLTTSNVVAILEGSDPVLKDEYVAIGAHYDHLGTSAKRPTHPATPSTTAPTMTDRAPWGCWPWPRPSPPRRCDRSGRSSSCGTRARSRVSGARATTPSIRRCRWTGSWPS